MLNWEQLRLLMNGGKLKTMSVFFSMFRAVINCLIACFYIIFYAFFSSLSLCCRRYAEQESLGMLASIQHCVVNMISCLQTLLLPVSMLGLHHRV